MRRIIDKLTLPLLLIVLCGIALAMQLKGNDSLSDIGTNLFAEFVGAAVTVYGINFLLQRRDERRLLPIKAAVYEDVRVMTHWALNLCKEAYTNVVGDTEPKSWSDLLSSATVTRVLKSLDITKPARVIPAQSWSVYFDYQMQRINQHAEKILERHSGALDPEVHSAIYTLVYHRYQKITEHEALDRQRGIPRPTNLGTYFPLVNEWFESVLFLHNWTVKTHPTLVARGIKRVYAPCHFSLAKQQGKPQAAFESGALEAQLKRFTEWQKRESANPKAGV